MRMGQENYKEKHKKNQRFQDYKAMMVSAKLTGKLSTYLK